MELEAKAATGPKLTPINAPVTKARSTSSYKNNLSNAEVEAMAAFVNQLRNANRNKGNSDIENVDFSPWLVTAEQRANARRMIRERR